MSHLAHKNAKDQEYLLNHWAGVEIRDEIFGIRLASTFYGTLLLVGLLVHSMLSPYAPPRFLNLSLQLLYTFCSRTICYNSLNYLPDISNWV